MRDINWNNDGSRYISAGFDKTVRIVDTETGQQVHKIETPRTPYCAKFYPLNNNEVLFGTAERKVVQWDLREDKMVQEYTQHMAAVNTITFLDDDRRFASTSDDKTIRVWEYGIDVTIKCVRASLGS